MKRVTLLCIFAASLFGQTADEGILGTVTDESGSVIVGAPVTISNGPVTGWASALVTLATWNARIASTAMARSESNSAKRGLPGGGATAGEGAAGAGAVRDAATR